MWTAETRAEHDRDDLRYPSDLTDAEWQILAPLLPPPAETGRHRCWPMREMMNAIFFVLRGGCPWRMLPEHFPPHQTTYRWFTRFRDDGTWETLNHHLVTLDRQRVGREASPSAAIIRRASQALGGRALLRLARPQSPSGERLRGHHRLGHCLPLCRIRPAAHAAAGSFGLSFESDSQIFIECGAIGPAYSYALAARAIRQKWRSAFSRLFGDRLLVIMVP